MSDPRQRTRSSSTLRLGVIDFSLVAAAKRVIEGALSVVPGERVLVVADQASKELAKALVDATFECKALSAVMILEDHGPRPLGRLPKPIKDTIGAAQASVFIATFGAGEQQMRAEFVQEAMAAGLRHAHMVGVTRRSMVCGFAADPQRIASVARLVRMRMRPDSELVVKSAAGTDLTIRCEPAHRCVEHTGIIRPGRWENLPTGEVVTTPKDVKGIYICNASMSESFGAVAGALRDTPVRLTIEGGYVRSVHCAHAQLERDLRAWMRSERDLDRIGIVSLGVNIGVADPVGEIICDQNLPGVHLGLGCTFPEETRASWNANGHLVMAGAYADVDLDGTPLIRSGRYLQLA